MSPDQQTLIELECATCGNPLPYAGRGRPRKFCDDCRPQWFPKLTGIYSGINGPAARAGDPVNSHIAAASITPGRTEERVLRVLRQRGPLNPDEIAAHLPNDLPETIKSCMARLKRAGLAHKTGYSRPSKRGRPSEVWALGDR